jgi:hypothetical protein
LCWIEFPILAGYANNLCFSTLGEIMIHIIPVAIKNKPYTTTPIYWQTRSYVTLLPDPSLGIDAEYFRSSSPPACR